ncbi:MAG TPA: Ig-like domain-containing protein [Allosphingosinicella sp.]|jgi:VCBS repeat-containing protein
MVATVLAAGDIAIVQYSTEDSDDPSIAGVQGMDRDVISFVLLKAIDAGTTIYFTDRAWTPTANSTTLNAGSFAAASGSEGTFTFTTGADLAAGTVFTITTAQLNAAGIKLSDTGETIYAFQGLNANTPTSFLYAIDVADENTTFNGNLTNTGLSVAANTATAIGADNGVFAARTNNIQMSQLLDSINDANDWAQNANSPFTPTPNGYNLFTAPDQAVWVAGSGGGNGVIRLSQDATLSQGAIGYAISTIYGNTAGDGNSSTATNRVWHPTDIVLDTVNDRFFIADSDGTIDRILQGRISEMLANPGAAPNLTILYREAIPGDTDNDGDIDTPASSDGTGITGIALDPANGIVYFARSTFLQKVNYNTENQTAVTLVNLGINPATNNPYYTQDIAYNATTNTFFVISSESFSDFIDEAGTVGTTMNHNSIFRIDGVSPTDTNATGNVAVKLTFGASAETASSATGALDPTSFEDSLGKITGIDINTATGDVWFTAVQLNGGANGATGGIYKILAADANRPAGPGGAPALVYSETNATNRNFQFIDIDEATGRYYVTSLEPNTANQHKVYRGSLTGTGTQDDPIEFATVGNVNGLSPLGINVENAPTLTGNGLAAAVTEASNAPGSGETSRPLLFGNLVASDIDTAGGDELAGAQVRISGNFLSGATHQDILRIQGNTNGTIAASGITYSYDQTVGVLTLSGIATVAEYQSALQLVTFSTSGDNITNYGAAITRTVSASVSDGLLYSQEVDATVNVTGINDAPFNTPGAAMNFSEDTVGSAGRTTAPLSLPVNAITGVSVFDVDADPATQDISVTLSVGLGTITIRTDVVGGIVAADITGGANGSGTITITATQNEINATLAATSAAVTGPPAQAAAANGLIYTPPANYNGATPLTIVTNDLGNNGNDPALTGGGLDEQDTDSKTLNIADVNDAPIVGGDGTVDSPTILEDTPFTNLNAPTVADLFGAQFADPTDVKVSGANPTGSTGDTFAGIAITSNGSNPNGSWQYWDGDSWENIAGASVDAAPTFSASTLLRFNPAPNFNSDEGGVPTLTARLIESGGPAIVNNATVDLNPAPPTTGPSSVYSAGSVTLSQAITPVNDAPVLGSLNGDAVTYTEGGAAIRLDAAANTLVSDVDSADFDGGSLRVAITANEVASEDFLGIAQGGSVSVSNLVVSVNNVAIGTITGDGTGGSDLVISFNANATPAAVQDLVRALTYRNANNINPGEAARTVTITLNDGDGQANGGDADATVTTIVHVAGVNDEPTGLDKLDVALNEDATRVFVAADFGFTDQDGNGFGGVQIVTLPGAGTIKLNGVAISSGAIIGAQEIANGKLTYTPAPNGNGDEYANFTFAVRDDGASAESHVNQDQSPNTFSFDVAAINDAPVFTAPTFVIQRVSTNSANAQTTGTVASAATFSPDGTKILFTSNASDLVPGDTNGLNDVFYKDLATGVVARLSVDGGGQQGNINSFSASFSPDGNSIVFQSDATNLVPGDTNVITDVFIRNILTGENTRISTAANGDQATGPGISVNNPPLFSPDGLKVAFASSANNLVPGDTNDSFDIFVRTLSTGAITRVSAAADGTQADAGSFAFAFSPDGSAVVFQSGASNLVADDTNAFDDIFVKVLATGAITRVSTNADGGQASGLSSNPVFSPDGSKVMFTSSASFLVPGDTNFRTDIFIKELATGAISRVSTDSNGGQANAASTRATFSPDGSKIVFSSDASNLVAGDTNGVADIFVKDLTSGAVQRVSVDGSGAASNGASQEPTFSPDGTRILFTSNAANLVVGDTNGNRDLFVATLGAAGTPSYRENGAPTQVVGVANLSDVDAANFAGGTFSAAISFSTAGDALTIAGTGGATGIDLVGSSVRYNGVEIGTLTSTGTSLSVALDADATRAAVKALTEAVRIANTTENPTGSRSVVFTLNDGGNSGGGGAQSTSFTQTVTFLPVNDAPSGTDKTIETSEDDAYTFALADFGFSDIDGHSILGVVITTLPTNGSLTFFGTVIGAGFDAAFDAIANGALKFVPDADEFGAPYATFTFQVRDMGGTANGGIDTDQSPNTITVNVTADNFAPVLDLDDVAAGKGFAGSFTEDGAAAAIVADVAITDQENDQITGATVTITDTVAGDSLAIGGILPTGISASSSVVNGNVVLTLTGAASADDYEAALELVLYSSSSQDPTSGGTDLSRTITTVIRDAGGTSLPATSTITIDAVNDAPVNANAGTASGNEDATIAVTGLSVSDADAGTQDITVTLGVTRGTLDIATNVAGGVEASDISGDSTGTIVVTASQRQINTTLGAANGLLFSGGANANGTVALTVTSNDGGATGSSGAQQDQDQYTITINAVNDAPTVVGDGDESGVIAEDTPSGGQSVSTIFGAQYSDAADTQSAFPGGSSPGSFGGIAVIANGSGASGQWQYLNGSIWTDIGAASASSAKLFDAGTSIRFNPAANFNGPAPTLTVRLIDNSQPAAIVNGSTVDLSGAGATGGTTAFSTGTVVLGQTVTAVNDAPSGTSTTVTINEDASRVLGVADFPFTDVDGNGLLSVTIDGVTGGTILFDADGAGPNAPVAATFPATYSVADLNAGKVVFQPTANLNGNGAGSISFRVRDNGGTSPGQDADVSANTLTVNIASVNDAPTSADRTQNIIENTDYVFSVADFPFSDVDGNVFSRIEINFNGLDGTLLFDSDGTGPGAPQPINAISAPLSALTNGQIRFRPDPDETGTGYASLRFRVTDDGGTARGGSNISGFYAFTFNVAPDRRPPVATDDVNSAVEDSSTTGNVLSNDSDPNGDPLTVSAVSFGGTSGTVGQAIKGTYGTLTLNRDGSYTYAADQDLLDTIATGTTGLKDVFTYDVSDNVTGSDTGTLTINVSTANDELVTNGGSGHDTIYGDRTAPGIEDTIYGLSGNDTIYGLGGADDLFGGTGNDQLFGGEGWDELYGADGNDRLDGGAGNDLLDGGTGVDQLFGRAGVDRLLGGSGNDILDGGAGADVLNGGSGYDVFIFLNAEQIGTKAGAHDLITDFVSGTDKIDLSAIYGGRAFSGVSAGSNPNPYGISTFNEGGSTWVVGDVDGDTNADFAIELTGTLRLKVSDFIVSQAQWNSHFSSSGAAAPSYSVLHSEGVLV